MSKTFVRKGDRREYTLFSSKKRRNYEKQNPCFPQSVDLHRIFNQNLDEDECWCQMRNKLVIYW